MAQRVKHLPTMRETQVRSLGWEYPLEKAMAPTPVLLPGKSHGQRNLIGYSPWGRKELDMTERFHFLFFFFLLYTTFILQVLHLYSFITFIITKSRKIIRKTYRG